MHCDYPLPSVGLAFWKSPRRKLFAVIGKGRKRPIVLDSDDDDFEPTTKRLRTENKLDIVLDTMDAIKETLSDVMSLTKDTRIPVGLKRLMRDAFKCNICHTVPVRPPVIVTKCCKKILGCEPCVNHWYSGDEALTKTCPACRADRGYNETMLLRGLDEFLIGVRQAIQTEDERDEEELPAVTVD